MIYLHGGPGGSAISGASGWLDHPLREDRDFILLDQRVTGYSEPALCPQLSRDDMMVVARDLSPDEATAARLALSLACRDSLLERGVDLGSYSSDASAADLVDLRRVLGYDCWNLYGISYGTKLALTMLRNSPEGVRSVVLDSAYPPGVHSFDQRTINFVRALKVLFESCASDAACRAAYPSLKQDFFETMEDLRERPLTIRIIDEGPIPIDEFTINLQDFLVAAHQMLYRRPMITLVPFTLEAIKTRNQGALYGLVESFGERGLQVGRDVYNLVECYERGPFGSREAYEALTAEHPRLRAGFTHFDVDQELCDSWSEDHAGPEETLAVKSDVPSLVLAGDYDPITPPAWGRRAAQTLEKSFFFQFPGVGHAASASHPCPEAITVAFVQDPTREPDASCVAEMEPLAFVTDLHVNSGVYRFSKALLVERDTGVVVACAAITLALLSGALWSSVAALIRRRMGWARREKPTLAALLLTALAWRSAGWSPWRRLLHSVAILGCVGFLGLLFWFGIF